MNPRYAQLGFVAALAVIGCVPSLFPVYSEKDVVFEPALLGTWQEAKSQNTWQFTRHGENNFLLTYTERNGPSGRFVAHVAQVEGLRFLDLYPEKEDVQAAGFYKYHLLPLHTIYLLERTSPQLELVSLDLKWLNDHLTEHPDALSHTTVNGQKILTAPTAELQAFLLKHRDKFTGRFQLAPLHGADTQAAP